MHDLTGFQRDCLRAIAEIGSCHGLAIKEELERDYKGDIHHGRLYPNLNTLVEMGLVRKEEEDGRTNNYSLTQRAEREIEEYLARWQKATSISA